jgi:hypothetical protein
MRNNPAGGHVLSVGGRGRIVAVRLPSLEGGDQNMADDINRTDVDDDLEDDGVQHGIDDDPNNDAAKGAALGGIGGAAVGAAAGSMLGPLGALGGAAVGGLAGAIASGAAVGAVDKYDNDNTISGVGEGATEDINDDTTDTRYVSNTGYAADTTTDRELASAGRVGHTDTYTDRGDVSTDVDLGNDVPGIQTGGLNDDGSPDTRGVTEKVSDAVTGDRYDDKTGKRI